MSDLNPLSVTEDAFSWKTFLRNYVVENSAFISMMVLALIGIGYTDIAAQKSYWYWQALVPVFGILCVVTGWSQAQDSQHRWELVRTQVLHWGAFLLGTYLVFLPVMQTVLDNIITGLILLLMLAFSTFLAGIYINWRFCVVGVFIGIAVLISAFFRQITLLMLLIAIALLIASILFARYMTKNRLRPT